MDFFFFLFALGSFALTIVLALLLYLKHQDHKWLWREYRKIRNQLDKPRRPGPVKSPPIVERHVIGADEAEFNWEEYALKDMESKYKYPRDMSGQEPHYFTGKRVVITGTLHAFPIRNRLAKILWHVGADVNTTVSRKTDLVIVGEDPGWKKVELIEKHGTKTMTEAELLALIPDYDRLYP